MTLRTYARAPRQAEREYGHEADWENEGGARRIAMAARTSRPSHVSAKPGGDPETGFSDTHTLSVLQASLVLLILPLAGMLVFWVAVAARGAP